MSPRPARAAAISTSGEPRALTSLDADDQAICDEVGPYLAARGQFFVGLDIIGGKLTGLNVTSPTGMQEVNRMGGLSGAETMQARFWDGVQRKL